MHNEHSPRLDLIGEGGGEQVSWHALSMHSVCILSGYGSIQVP